MLRDFNRKTLYSLSLHGLEEKSSMQNKVAGNYMGRSSSNITGIMAV